MIKLTYSQLKYRNFGEIVLKNFYNIYKLILIYR